MSISYHFTERIAIVKAFLEWYIESKYINAQA